MLLNLSLSLLTDKIGLILLATMLSSSNNFAPRPFFSANNITYTAANHERSFIKPFLYHYYYYRHHQHYHHRLRRRQTNKILYYYIRKNEIITIILVNTIIASSAAEISGRKRSTFTLSYTELISRLSSI